MPTLTKSKQDCPTVFALNGTSEDSASYALGWTLLQSSHLLTTLLESLNCPATPDIVERTEILLQAHHKNGGYSDLELLCVGEFHLIFEAKKHWSLPGNKQLLLYASRFNPERTPLCKVITVSAASDDYAARNLPTTVNDYPLSHISWGKLASMAKRNKSVSGSSIEKLWLGQLQKHLKGYDLMTPPNDNQAYCVVLSTDELRPGYTWVDVVEKDSAYFHPVGLNGWPSSPPNYIAFRKHGKLLSVHHIDSYDVVTDLSTINPNWPNTTVDHFVYSLGPAMVPPRAIKNGKIYASGRVWCALDTLLSGAHDTIQDARNETKRRLKDV